MGLIHCPECGSEKVSDTAEACPNCGFNIRDFINNQYIKNNEDANTLVNNNSFELKKNRDEKLSNRRSAGCILVLISFASLFLPFVFSEGQYAQVSDEKSIFWTYLILIMGTGILVWLDKKIGILVIDMLTIIFVVPDAISIFKKPNLDLGIGGLALSISAIAIWIMYLCFIIQEKLERKNTKN